ncbi:MAG: (E)-4-hydroxy-3-methylbut-2-enyl-diphosphate synthase [Muribaculum sp.]|nr:(E)-4-hydroxy-3-methylbut-2-enyl-diphosphate synthase [Muribaculum sp.]
MIYNYFRRPTREVAVGKAIIGGGNPIVLQSMTNTSTMDTEGSALQAIRIVREGGEIVRLTTQGEREAANMLRISQRIKELGEDVPLVADVHFNPRAALMAATTCEGVRINPGNFADPARTFKKLDFTDEEYTAEIDKIRNAVKPLIELCREHHTAIRLGVNHGSLSDRIMSRYGDTAPGMVESVMEYLRIFRGMDFNDIVISIKSSNTAVMVETVRLLASTMDAEGMNFPLHLGVTEAGDGEDGRVKSAVGIGTLLSEGLGDTIRVSLSEDPEREIPVARLLRDYITSREGHSPVPVPAKEAPFPSRDLLNPLSPKLEIAPGAFPMAVGADISAERLSIHARFASAEDEPTVIDDTMPIILTTANANRPGAIASWIERYIEAGGRSPIIVRLQYCDADKQTVEVKAGADFGALLLNGYASGIWLDAPSLSKEELDSISLCLLQAARLRFTRTEYISCPSCGRTLFDLQQTLKEVKEATAHLKGLKIGVMGCVVNGPGEMADADYGYVGAGPGRVSIYKGKTLIRKNIPTDEALPALLHLIETDRIPEGKD